MPLRANGRAEDGKFGYVMISGSDDLLIERCPCREPQRWPIARPRVPAHRTE